MKPIYLKFSSENEAMKVLYPYCHMDDAGKFLSGKDMEGYSVDIIGTISPATEFHVNMLVPDTFDELSMFEVFPVSPSRVFGGFSPEDLARD